MKNSLLKLLGWVGKSDENVLMECDDLKANRESEIANHEHDVSFKPAIKLIKSMKDTARSRFYASKRLSSKDRSLTLLTSMTSGYLIILTVLPYIMDIGASGSGIINFITVSFAVIILVSSLFQYSSSNVVNAEQHHRCGLEINEIIRELISIGSAVGPDEYRQYSIKYNSILQKYSVNHEDVDYMAVQLDRPQDFPWNGFYENFIMRINLLASLHLPRIFLSIITAGFLYIVYIYALQKFY